MKERKAQGTGMTVYYPPQRRNPEARENAYIIESFVSFGFSPGLLV
jgi:hypothetical protein